MLSFERQMHVLALSSEALSDQKDPPTNIQWMPPGTHTITAFSGGQPKTVTVIVDKKTADVLQSQLQSMLIAARAGVADRPYLDFNHEDSAAAGFITKMCWGGDDPQAGGIRVFVDWSQPGLAAIKGHAYRRFSPSFFVDSSNRVCGFPLNMGGLVNKAAFTSIAPVAAKGLLFGDALAFHHRYSPEAFPLYVHSKCAAGMTKADAICASVREIPEAYESWVVSGCKGL
jgi:hypothetical protein